MQIYALWEGVTLVQSFKKIRNITLVTCDKFNLFYIAGVKVYYNKYQSKVDLHRSNFGIACIKQFFEGVAGDKLRQTCDGRVLFVGPVDKRKKNEKILSAFITDIMKIRLHIACFGYSGVGKFSIERMKKNFVSLFPHERRFKHAYLIGLSSNGISALIARNINRESKKI